MQLDFPAPNTPILKVGEGGDRCRIFVDIRWRREMKKPSTAGRKPTGHEQECGLINTLPIYPEPQTILPQRAYFIDPETAVVQLSGAGSSSSLYRNHCT
jgi:hypothetical protein